MKGIVSRRDAEIAEKKRIYDFNTKKVVVFLSVASVTRAKRARENVVVFENCMISSEASEKK